MAVELREFRPTRVQVLMGESQIGEALRASLPEYLLLLLCLFGCCHFSLVSGMVGMGLGDLHCL